MENCVWALARWADTYLFPEEDLPAPLKQAYGDPAASANGGDGAAAAGAPQPHQPGSGEGLAVLDMAVQVANACLTSFPGEGELHKQVCASQRWGWDADRMQVEQRKQFNKRMQPCCTSVRWDEAPLVASLMLLLTSP